MCGGASEKSFIFTHKKAIIILLCMVSIFLCGLVIGYNIGLEERYKLLQFITKNMIIPPKVTPFNPFNYF